MTEFQLPWVSVIIVNYNYQAYLERAFRSVAAQTYPFIEKIIVDDKSTDQSCAVIDKICAEDPSVIALKMTENGGQSIASLQGFRTAKGSLIYFIDADDEIFPDCVEAHVFAHLSSRVLVAFTTVDILNNVSGEVINFSHPGFSRYVASRTGIRPELLRPMGDTMKGTWFETREPCLEADQIHFVLAPHVEPWVWSPTSANCYRRDVLDLLLCEPELRKIRWGTDAYLIRPLSGLFGSILIDRPLMQYMIHATNRFIKTAPIHNLRIFDSTSTDDDMRHMARTAVMLLMRHVARDKLAVEPHHFFDVMRALCDGYPGPPAHERYGEHYGRELIANRSVLELEFGSKAVAEEFARQHGRDKQAKRYA